MADILFVKTSSMGDIIHHLPAVTDLRRQFPQARIGWVVEEAYLPLVRLHPAVDDIFPVAWRRWRKSLFSAPTWREIREHHGAIRARRYDAIIDTQGLLRSALIARSAHGTRHGYDSASIREPLASALYNVRHKISRDTHVIERNRRLTGLALGYEPQGAPDFGVARERLRNDARSHAVVMHATARASKDWPVERWIELGPVLASFGLDILLLSGTHEELARAQQIAAARPDARALPPAPLQQAVDLIGAASFVIGGDTGLVHVAAAFGVPVVAIYSGSDAVQARPVGPGPIATAGDKGAPPSAEQVGEALRRVLG
jgi:heptosyltransferase-1